MNARDHLDTAFYVWFRNCPVRLLNALESEGKRTLRDVVSMSEIEVLGLRNVGQTSLYALKQKLLVLGLQLGCVPTEPESPKLADMLLRDYFAGQALAGMLANKGNDGAPWDELAATSYGIADALFAAREESRCAEVAG